MFNSKFNMLLLVMVAAMAMERQEDDFDPMEKFAADKVREDGQIPFILVMGQTGVGKSRTLCNAAGDDADLPEDEKTFYWSAGLQSVSVKPQLKTIRLFGDECKLVVMDTCGLGDTQGRTTAQVKVLLHEIEEVTKSRAMNANQNTADMSLAELQKLKEEQKNHGGIHLVVIVTNDGDLTKPRLCKETREMFAQLAEILGPRWEDNAAIVSTCWKDPEIYRSTAATHADVLKSLNPTKKKFRSTTPELRYLKKKPEDKRYFESAEELVDFRANYKIRAGIAQHNMAGWTEDFKCEFSKHDLYEEDDDRPAIEFVKTKEFTDSERYEDVELYKPDFTPIPQVSHIPVYTLDNMYNVEDESLPAAHKSLNKKTQMAVFRELADRAFKNKPMNTKQMKVVLSQRDQELETAIAAKAKVAELGEEIADITEEKKVAEEAADAERERRVDAETDAEEQRKKVNEINEQVEQERVQNEQEREAIRAAHEQQLNDLQAEQELRDLLQQKNDELRRMTEQRMQRKRKREQKKRDADQKHEMDMREWQVQMQQQQQQRGTTGIPLLDIADRLLGGGGGGQAQPLPPMPTRKSHSHSDSEADNSDGETEAEAELRNFIRKVEVKLEAGQQK